MVELNLPICTKCGKMLEDTKNGYVVIGSKGDRISFVYHSDICDGQEITILDVVKILSERGTLPFRKVLA